MILGSPAPVIPRSVVRRLPLHAVPSSVRSHKRPDRVASVPKEAPLPLLNHSKAQTEDGQAMMKADTFHALRNLSQEVVM